MQIIKDFFKWYTYITTGILGIITILFASVYRSESVTTAILWQIMVSSFVTTLLTICMKYGMGKVKCLAKWNGMLGNLLHYLLISIVMLILGSRFGWFHFEVFSMAIMLLAIGGVYLFVYGVYWLIDLYQADKINKRLKEKYSNKEK